MYHKQPAPLRPLGGRPALWSNDLVVLAEKAARLGAATYPELATFFEVSESTIETWMAKPEFAEAVYRGREPADAEVASALYQRAVGYSQPAVKIFMVDQIETTEIDGETVIVKNKVEKYVPYTEHFPPDVAAAKFWLTNRQKHRWKERVEVDNKGNGPVVVNTGTVNMTQVNAEQGSVVNLYQQMLKRGD